MIPAPEQAGTSGSFNASLSELQVFHSKNTAHSFGRRITPMNPELNLNVEQHDFEKLAAQASPGVVREFWDFLRNNKKWWLTPIVIIMLLFGALLFLSSTAAAPFIYTLF
jgi:hypothetical protein